MFTTLPLFKNPLKNAKNVKQLKHTLMEFDAKYQTKAIGELVKDERYQAFFTNFSELKEFLMEVETYDQDITHRLDYIVANTLKETLLLFVTTFNELIQLTSVAIAGLLCNPKPMYEKFVNSPQQLDDLLRKLGPGCLDFVVASIDLAWIMKIIRNLDDL